jgi:hypothetical protein
VFRNTLRRSKNLAAAIAVVALAVPTTSVALPREAIDHRSPDAVDAAIQAQEAQRNHEHLQGLDARRQAPGYVDLRSPDASDTGFVRSPAPLAVEESPGFSWGDAGIGAGTMLGLLLVGFSAMLSVTHRRNRASTT